MDTRLILASCVGESEVHLRMIRPDPSRRKRGHASGRVTVAGKGTRCQLNCMITRGAGQVHLLSLSVSIALLSIVPGFMSVRQSVGAQSPPEHGRVEIRVVDTDSVAVVGAEVLMQRGGNARMTARSDTAGRAHFDIVAPGIWSVMVRRIGVRPMTTTIRTSVGNNAYTLVASSVALELRGMRVIGGVIWSPRLDDFERRRLSGSASAIVTREQIDRLDPPQLSRMLRGMNGLRVGDSAGYTVAISTRGSKPTRNSVGVGFSLVQCVLRVVVDGTLMPALFNIDEIVPRDVHGIEVYYGPARMPPELAGLRTDNWCGVIAIWTRDR